MLSHTRCLIQKKEQWEYDQEWRMIDTAGDISCDTSRVTKRQRSQLP